MTVADCDPFAVLGLAGTANPREIEREAAKLIAMLALGLSSAATYDSPSGPRPRTADDVRAAAARLRDPRQRLAAELMAGVDPARAVPSSTGPDVLRWPDAMIIAGWQHR